MSTKPGVTSAPSASMVRRAAPSTAPTSVTRPSVIATSAVRAGAPVPSTTVPPRITRSCTSCPLQAFDDRHVGLAPTLAHGLQAVAAARALELVEHRRHQPRAGGAERVPECDGAAVDVDL